MRTAYYEFHLKEWYSKQAYLNFKRLRSEKAYQVVRVSSFHQGYCNWNVENIHRYKYALDTECYNIMNPSNHSSLSTMQSNRRKETTVVSPRTYPCIDNLAIKQGNQQIHVIHFGSHKRNRHTCHMLEMQRQEDPSS